MAKKKNPNGSRVERENKFADALGLGTGRTFMGACLSSFESGAKVTIIFDPPHGPQVRYCSTPPPQPADAQAGGRSRSILRREAAQRGETAPEFDGGTL